MNRLLVIDDDTRLRNLLGKFLSEHNFTVLLAKDVAEAIDTINKEAAFDLMIVDVMMPGKDDIKDGMDFVRYSKNSNPTPILMLTARDEASDRITGLEAGADDYLAKPFEPKELLLRINNILRYNQNSKKEEGANVIYKFGKFGFNPTNSRLCKIDNNIETSIYLTESEAKILAILCKNQGNVVKRENLSTLCTVSDRSIDVQITRLRKKIESNPKQPRYIQTVRNLGYALYN